MGFRLFKPTYRDDKEPPRVRRLPAFASRAASEEMGRSLAKLVGYFKGSGGQTDPALTRWLSGLAVRTREKLVNIGLLDRERAGAAKVLSVHIDDWAKALQAKGTS